MQKQIFQPLNALLINVMQLCGPWITHKNDIRKHLGQVFEITQIQC